MSNKEIRERLMNEMIEYHNNKNPGLNLTPKIFYPKIKYSRGIFLYERELALPEFYFELTDSNYTGPIDSNRTLYQWIGNEFKKEEYTKNESSFGTSYTVPFEEFIEYKHITTEKVPEKLELYDSTVRDSPYEKMTMRDYCAIQWMRPVSEKQWLNDLIKQEQR